MKFEYIASGLDFVFRNTIKVNKYPEVCNEILRTAKIMDTKYPSSKFGVLFNAYTERSNAKDTYEIFKGLTIQADSGGLQMMTLGHGQISEEEKKKVYACQAKYSTIAMSFDEIPIKLVDERAEIHNYETKFYDPLLMEECAKKSGQNLLNQIEYFIEHKSHSKPLMIIQGNCMETYMRWTDIMMKTIPQDYWKYIGGISSSSFCLGNGFKEDVERAFTLSQLQVPDHIKKHVHLLGVGAMNRLVPAIQFRRSGLFTDDMLFSYDSTKHTGGCSRGQFQYGNKIIQLSRNKCPKYLKFSKEILEFNEKELNNFINEDDLFMTIIKPNSEWEKKYGSKTARIKERNMAVWGFFLFSVNQTMKAIEDMVNNQDTIPKYCNEKFEFVKSLSSIKTIDDYNSWKRHVSKYLVSKSVKRIDTFSTLEAHLG